MISWRSLRTAAFSATACLSTSMLWSASGRVSSRMRLSNLPSVARSLASLSALRSDLAFSLSLSVPLSSRLASDDRRLRTDSKSRFICACRRLASTMAPLGSLISGEAVRSFLRGLDQVLGLGRHQERQRREAQRGQETNLHGIFLFVVSDLVRPPWPGRARRAWTPRRPIITESIRSVTRNFSQPILPAAPVCADGRGMALVEQDKARGISVRERQPIPLLTAKAPGEPGA